MRYSAYYAWETLRSTWSWPLMRSMPFACQSSAHWKVCYNAHEGVDVGEDAGSSAADEEDAISQLCMLFSVLA